MLLALGLTAGCTPTPKENGGTATGPTGAAMTARAVDASPPVPPVAATPTEAPADAVSPVNVPAANEEPVVITRESQREAAVGRRVTIRGVLTRTKIPTVCGIDVGDAYELSDRNVVVKGVLQRTVELPRDPSAPQVASRGPGTFYRVVDPATGRTAKPVAR